MQHRHHLSVARGTAGERGSCHDWLRSCSTVLAQQRSDMEEVLLRVATEVTQQCYSVKGLVNVRVVTGSSIQFRARDIGSKHT